MARVCDRCGKTHVVTYMDKREGTEIDFCKECKEAFLEFIKPDNLIRVTSFPAAEMPNKEPGGMTPPSENKGIIKKTMKGRKHGKK